MPGAFPVAGVLLELAVKRRVGAQRAAEGGFVVWDCSPSSRSKRDHSGDGVALLAQIVGAFRHAGRIYGCAAAAGIGAPSLGSLHLRFCPAHRCS